MTEAHTGSVSLADRVRSIAAGAPVVGVHGLGEAMVFVLGEEALLFIGGDGSERRIAVHAGAVLASAADAQRILTGGDDGTVVATDIQSATTQLAADAKRRWIDHVALGPGGAVAWSAGKTAFVRIGDNERALGLASTVGGLAFAPKGLRLAVAHYNGVSLWFPNAQAEPELLTWKGSHHSVTFSPDNRFLVSAMQEPTLHGWRLSDRHDMRMSGYAARVRSLDWTADGKWLATSGGDRLVLWPFQSKEGPMSKQPRMLAPGKARVTAVACHPKQPVAAAGYADGLVLLVRLDDGAALLVRRPDAIPVSALGWHPSGKRLAFGTDAGEAGILGL